MNIPAILAPRKLTRGQLQVLELIAAGYTAREASRQLGISDSGVSACCDRIRLRIGARNAVDMAVLALDRGLLDRGRVAQLRAYRVDQSERSKAA